VLSSNVVIRLTEHQASKGPDAAEQRRETILSLRAIEALARAMTARDPLTQQHSQRVQHYAVALAWEAGIHEDRMLEAMEPAALLHDIGKLGIPDRLLGKPGPLTPDEYDQVKQHAVIGADILSSVALPGSLVLIVRHHHEHWDGSGYPDGLCGEAIPIGARVLAIADSYDALTSDRPYRRALSHAAAVAILQAGRGTMYDPRITDVFLRIEPRLRSSRATEHVGQLQTLMHVRRLGKASAG
jgi:putative nucleotidyltransferase with HDIG domain